jgi:protocatechuate 3,4-dioxygenase beta subunit
MRQNVKEEKYSDGVDVFLEVQYIDINTCRPVPGALVDIWQANATGVYRLVLFLNPANPNRLVKRANLTRE